MRLTKNGSLNSALKKYWGKGDKKYFFFEMSSKNLQKAIKSKWFL